MPPKPQEEVSQPPSNMPQFEGLVDGLNDLPLTPAPLCPFGHRLRHFYRAWEHITQDRWVLEIIYAGYSIPFTPCPPTLSPSPSLFRDTSHEHLLRLEVDHLLQLGAMEPVSTQFRGKGFII